MTSDNAATNRVLISQLLQEDPELRDIVEEFIDGLTVRLEELKAAYAQLDFEQLATLAHRLKGAGGSYGYPDISQLCANLEQQFRAHDAANFDTQLAQLEQLAQAAVDGLRRS
jgi:HPt (histidine-containing phosphotransfer) domain-containing protein